MRKVKVRALTKEAFEPYGVFSDLTEPKGHSLDGFYPDRVLFPTSGAMPFGISSLQSAKPDKMIVTKAEYHNTTGEGILCLNDDVVVHVAPASNHQVPELTEAFLVPKGTFVKLHAGVWHLAAFPVTAKMAQVFIMLPQRTYMNDCVVVEYQEDQWMELEL